jgi:hypothetical protein
MNILNTTERLSKKRTFISKGTKRFLSLSYVGEVCLGLLLHLAACTNPMYHNDASLHFDQDNHIFGTIPFREEATCTFEFTNTGNTMLIVQDVLTSCWCTVPEWTKQPVSPGKKGRVTIRYNADFTGKFVKTISVFYNGTDSPFELKISGIVEYPDDLGNRSQ